MERGENTEREGESTVREGETTEIKNAERDIEYTQREGENTEIENVEREGENREGEGVGEVGEGIRSERDKWGNRTEEWLCDAAIRGDVESLNEIITIDKYILDKVLAGAFKGKNPLHVAVSIGNKEFVEKLLEKKRDLVKVLDTELGSALHIASSQGYLDIVKLLLTVSPGMCVARDQEGNNPLHIAAMQGKVEVLEVLLQTSPHAARVKVDRGDSILHLCVNYNQLDSLKLLLEMVGDKEFVNSTDTNGNTILHLAVFGKRFEVWVSLSSGCYSHVYGLAPSTRYNRYAVLIMIIECVLENSKIDVNARNGSEWTVMDIIYRAKKKKDGKKNGSLWPAMMDIIYRVKKAMTDIIYRVNKKERGKEDGNEDGNVDGKKEDGKKDGKGEYDSIEKVLLRKRACRRKELYIPFEASWQKEKKETLMIVSSLFATIAFTVGVNPPGGVWPDTSSSEDPLPHHVAGKAITATYYPNAYNYFTYFNTVGFLLSLTTILELIVALPGKYWLIKIFRSMISWMTIMITAFAYTFSVNVISPTENYEKSVSYAIVVTVSVWAAMITYFRLVPYKMHMLVYSVMLWLILASVAVVPMVLFCILCIPVCICPCLIPKRWIQFLEKKAKKTKGSSELPT